LKLPSGLQDLRERVKILISCVGEEAATWLFLFIPCWEANSGSAGKGWKYISWYMTPFSLVDVYRRFRGTAGFVISAEEYAK
jgi:hypothetical protein